MSLYYPIPQPTIANDILVRRERRLPVPGEVVVRDLKAGTEERVPIAKLVQGSFH